MGRTTRFNLATFGADGGSIADDGYKFSAADRRTMDAVLAALEGHDHTPVAALADPSGPPDATLELNAGTMPAGQTYTYRVSFVDRHGLETAASDETEVATPDPVPEPDVPALTIVDGGTLAPGSYYYAVSYYTADGGETLPSPVGQVTLRDPAAVLVDYADLPPTAVGVRVYRKSPNDADLYRLAEVTGGSQYTDTGGPVIIGASPRFTNTTGGGSAVRLTVPDVAQVTADPSPVAAWRIYRTLTSGSYGAASLVAEVRETATETGGPLVDTYLDTGEVLLEGVPAERSTTLAGQPTVRASPPSGTQTGDLLRVDAGQLVALGGSPGDILTYASSGWSSGRPVFAPLGRSGLLAWHDFGLSPDGTPSVLHSGHTLGSLSNWTVSDGALVATGDAYCSVTLPSTTVRIIALVGGWDAVVGLGDLNNRLYATTAGDTLLRTVNGTGTALFSSSSALPVRLPRTLDLTYLTGTLALRDAPVGASVSTTLPSGAPGQLHLAGSRNTSDVTQRTVIRAFAVYRA